MIEPYLFFDNNCKDAIDLYKKAFDGKLLEFQKYGDMPPDPNFPIADEDKELILHFQLKIGDATIMGADTRMPINTGNNIHISITLDDISKAQKAWEILKDGGQVQMELEPSFFAKLHGSLSDKFGINWMFTVA